MTKCSLAILPSCVKAHSVGYIDCELRSTVIDKYGMYSGGFQLIFTSSAPRGMSSMLIALLSSAPAFKL